MKHRTTSFQSSSCIKGNTSGALSGTCPASESSRTHLWDFGRETLLIERVYPNLCISNGTLKRERQSLNMIVGSGEKLKMLDGITNTIMKPGMHSRRCRLIKTLVLTTTHSLGKAPIHAVTWTSVLDCNSHIKVLASSTSRTSCINLEDKWNP